MLTGLISNSSTSERCPFDFRFNLPLTKLLIGNIKLNFTLQRLGPI